MPANEIHVNDTGTVLLVTIKDGDSVVDVSNAARKEIILKDPNGNVYTKNANYYTDGADGKITYTTASGDLNQQGMWQMQAFVQLGSYFWHSDKISFKIHPNLS